MADETSTTTIDEGNGEPPQRRRRSPWSRRNVVVFVLAAAAGVAAAIASDGRATGLDALDAAYRFVFAAGVTIAAAQARRWSWVVLGAAPAALSAWAGSIPASLALWVPLLLAVVSVAFDFRRRWLGALVGATAALALLHLPTVDPHGLTTLLAVASVVPVLVSARNRQRRRTRRRIDRAALVVGGVVVAIGVAFGIAGVLGARHASTGMDEARVGLAAAKAGDDTAAKDHLRRATDEFASADDAFGSPLTQPARLVPLLAYQATGADDLAGIGHDLAGAASDAATRANYRSIEVTDGRVDVARIEALGGPLDDVAAALADADAASTAVATEWLAPPLADKYAELRHDIADAADETATARLAVQVAPDLLGANGPRRYFVAFTTPAESRGLGGFIGNFAVLTADDGKLTMTRSGRNSDLQWVPGDPPRTLEAPPDYLARYGNNHPEIEVRDATLSPDFPSVAQALRSIYPQTRGGEPVDGVLAVDPYAIAAMLKITGPVKVDGLDEALTTDNAADILLRRQYLEFADDNAERIDFLDEATKTTFDRFIHTKGLKPTALANAFSGPVAEHRLVAWSADPAAQELFTRLGLDGAFPSADGDDLFALVTQNGGNNKIDVFLHRSVDYRATVDPATGNLQADVTITLRNDAPSSGLPPYVLRNRKQANQPDGTNWLWLNVYSPHDLESATIDGQPLALGMQAEFGLHVYQKYVAVPPGGAVTIKLKLSGAVDPTRPYRLVMPDQPLVNADEVRTTVSNSAG